MASFFLPQSLQKRLLRYALSRLEILDTDALDLEHLDISWGTKTTLEFRDVGLRLNKLAALLQLPPIVEILKARVLLLRLTVPVDIYSSAIRVEIDGVEIHAQISSDVDERPNSPSRPTNHKRQGKNHDKKNKSLGTFSGAAEDEIEDPVLPSAVNLAESFLETEPLEERAELEAAISSQPLSESMSSEDGDDDGAVGTGTSLALPSFMANFLKGIVDRLQVRIQWIVLCIDVEYPIEANNRSDATSSVEVVTIELKIDDIDIEGVTSDSDQERNPKELSARTTKRDKWRHIKLRSLRGNLISDAVIFAELAKPSSPLSPSTTQSDLVHGDREPQTLSSSHRTRPSEPDAPSSPRERLDTSYTGDRSHVYPNSESQELDSLSASLVASDSSRFDDAAEGDESSEIFRKSIEDHSELGDSILEQSRYRDHVTESQFADLENEETDESPFTFASAERSKQLNVGSPSATPRASVYMSSSKESAQDNPLLASINSRRGLKSTFLPSRARPSFLDQSVSHSEPISRPRVSNSQSNIHSEIETTNEDLRPTEYSRSNSSTSSTLSGEDVLAQSQFFSHEDAESMYMSALSHGSNQTRDVAERGLGTLSNEHATEAESSIHSSDSGSVRHDNLEHARHVLSNSLRDSVPPGNYDTSADTLSKETITTPLMVRPGSLNEREDAGSSGVFQPGATQDQALKSIVNIEQSKADSAMKSPTSNSPARSSGSAEVRSRVAKNLFSVDQVAVFLPPLSEPVAEDTNLQSEAEFTTHPNSDSRYDPSQSMMPQIPGTFSVYSAGARPKPTYQRPPPIPKVHPPEATERPNRVEILLGNSIVKFDISVGRLITKLFQGVSKSYSKNTPKSTPPTPHQKSIAPSTIFQLKADSIAIQFLERLAVLPVSLSGEPDTSFWADALDSAILLQASLKGLEISHETSQNRSSTTIAMHEFNFGYSKGDILSFDANLKLRESTRDLNASSGVDLKLSILNTQDATRCRLDTLPVHLMVDLQRLDEIFSWFGGLSSVLSMRSSMASNATTTPVTPPIAVTKSRGVRFESAVQPKIESVGPQNKFNIRLGGLVVDLIGNECDFSMDTSALKMVTREEGLGMTVDKVNISGPHLKGSSREAAVVAVISGTRLELLNTPKDTDLDRLLSLITPSKAKYDRDDDILLDTLLRQRRQGAVLRVTFDDFRTRISKLDELSYLPGLSEELKKLSTVAKYLPEDDRPGLLSLLLIRKLNIHIDMDSPLGSFNVCSEDIEVAQITIPALIALSIKSIKADRNGKEELLSIATDSSKREPSERMPAVMARIIGDEMDPVVRVKFWNLRVHYHVPLLMALLEFSGIHTAEDLAASMAISTATLTDRRGSRSSRLKMKEKMHQNPETKAMTIDLGIQDCILELNPLGLPSNILVILSDAHLSAVLPKDTNTSVTAEMGKGSILIIDDLSNITSPAPLKSKRLSFDGGSSQVGYLCSIGYVPISYITGARIMVNVRGSTSLDEKCVDVELGNDLFIMESCADSTQTLITTINDLKPPTVPSNALRYRTKVVPVQDMLASISADAFGTAEGNYDFDEDFGPGLDTIGQGQDTEDDYSSELGVDSQYYQEDDSFDSYDEVEGDSRKGSVMFDQNLDHDNSEGVLLDSFTEKQEVLDELDFQEDYFGTGSMLEGTAHRWNSKKNSYDTTNAQKLRESPFKICVRDVHIIWNLFDGYDWKRTRDTISKAVHDVEARAIEKRARHDRLPTFDQDVEDEESVINDFLFNSIYIGIPANRDPRELALAINQELNDNATETESVATTTRSGSTIRPAGQLRPQGRRLRLNRSKYHKITFELKGVNMDMVAFPSGSGETESSLDLRVRDFDIFDHLPTSTWKKFATYMQDAGERESGTSQIHLEVLNVRPVPELAASEIVLKATVLPLRLHVDQDALDFITRFFEFKDDSTPTNTSAVDVPFIQRAEVNSIAVKLDFKPKRVDYAGLRSGHTTEFMNFLILDEADMVLRHTIIYGISGFDKLGKCLNDIWMPDIKRNQLPGILAGLAPVRSLANVGSGVRDLYVVPMREYRKDGRVIRSITKGAGAFAKTTGTELVKLGAKLAIGTQTVLQGAEQLLTQSSDAPPISAAWEDDDLDEDEKRTISLYADQPVGVAQGLRIAGTSLRRDLLKARDAIIAVPGEVMDSGTAQGAAKAILRRAPTVILRPAIGASKAISQTLMGATNSLDPQNRRRVEDKYKKH